MVLKYILSKGKNILKLILGIGKNIFKRYFVRMEDI